MDNRTNLHESLFSRNSTPPTHPPPQQHPFPQHVANNSAPNLIDSLFQNISAPADHHPAPKDSHSIDIYTESAAIAPALSHPEDSVTAPGTVAERQNALLSLIGTGSSATANRPAPASQPSQQQSQQAPTPPGSSSRSNASPPTAGTQKILEQMIGGTARPPNFSDTQRNNPPQQNPPQHNPQQKPMPSPPYPQREEFRAFNQYEQPNDSSPRSRPIQNPQPPPQPQPQPQIQPPSPRRSMFEFTSAFDHLQGSTKKKPVPPQPSSISSGNDDSSSWPNVADPKRQTVENLLENLTRGQPQQHPATLQPQPPAYEAYLSGGDFSQVEPSTGRAPLPQIPGGKPAVAPARTSSPHSSSPKTQPLHRPQPRAPDVAPQPAQYNQHPPFASGHPIPPGPGRPEKDNSPGPRGNNARQKGGPPQSKFTNIKQISPGPQTQITNFDVSLALEEIQARESVKWTPIALVKQDSVFLPGSTIGATHWVAYAMTRGRVRVISRSSGDRTLLQLPAVFNLSASVIDMAVFGNRLSGVTSDGGFVVWELPELITDDVPGRLLLCVPPTLDLHDAIRAVKWHPKEVDTLAITTEDKIYVIDLANTHALHGQPLPHSDLHHIGQVFNVPSPVVAFDFDVAHYTLATISDDSTLTIWNMQDSQPYTVHKIRGDDIPSSLTFVDGGIVVGRKNGTIFQLLSMSDKTVLSTINFVNGLQDDPDMFGHISYDTRIQTLWVANSRRESLIALKLHMETSFAGGEENVRGYIEQVVEFSGIKPTIHFVILTADADPHGDEAHAACVAAKIVPGDVALVGFSVHSTGVDQVLIRKEWFDSALAHAESKFPGPPSPANTAGPLPENKSQRQPLPPLPANLSQSHSNTVSFPQPRARSPPSDDIDNEFSDGRHPDQKGKGGKAGKAVNWKEKEDFGKKEDKNAKPSDSSLINDSSLGQALSREIKKTEESLHSRIGKLIGKEMDKQHQRFEETRLHEQAEDFARQEKILKLISTELTRNTTRVVEMAVKSEVQTSVLPSLENITRNEVRAALHEQVELGLLDNITKGLPSEMEKLLLRPNISGHFSNLLTSALTPMIERHIKEILTTSFFQFHSQQSASMHQELMRELRGEISNIKTELGNWHNEALRGQETTIRELERTVRTLSEQVKFLSMNAPPPPSSLHHISQPQSSQNSPAGSANAPPAGNVNPAHIRQVNIPPPNAPVPTYVQSHPPFQQPPPPQPPIHQQWYTSIAAPQATHPATIPQATASGSQRERTPPVKTDQWDENYLGVLHSQDPAKLRELLLRTNPDLVLPLNGQPLVSQAVILTLIHRLSAIVGETAPTDETFKTSLWWLQRVAGHLRPDDKLISDFIPRVIPTVQQSLNTTKQRLAILPGGLGTMETARALSDIQEGLRRKVAQ